MLRSQNDPIAQSPSLPLTLSLNLPLILASASESVSVAVSAPVPVPVLCLGFFIWVSVTHRETVEICEHEFFSTMNELPTPTSAGRGWLVKPTQVL